MDYKVALAELLSNTGVEKEEIEGYITKTLELSNGDYTLPCFKLSKKFRKAPAMIAEDLKSAAEANLPAWIERVDAVNGYLNFYLNRGEFIKNVVTSPYPTHGKNGKNICIDYSSVNIAKPFHIGHLLTTVIGGSLYRIFDYLGYNVVGINHLGDYGTQFGKLITAYLKWGNGEEQTMDSLLKLYVKFHDEAEKDESLNDEARMWFKKIEDEDETAVAIFNTFKETTLREVDKVYKRLDITFDSYNGESFYNDKMDEIVDMLKQKNLLVESEGAYVVEMGEDIPPCLILKSDGASLYATRDLAAALYRKRTYDFDKNLYVVAYQQNLHFKQVFKVLELMGFDWHKDCVHVPFGMVSLENCTLSTRHGKVVFLRDVLDTAVKKTLDIINTKNPNLEGKEKVAEDVGVGAVIFGALSTGRIKDMVFSYDKALNFDGETGPYLQYTHARCCSLLEKGNYDSDKAVDFSQLTSDVCYSIIKHIDAFDATVVDAGEKYEPSIISRYLIDLAQLFNKFYFDCRVITDDEAATTARLKITAMVRDVLKKGMSLILLKAPEKM